MDEVINVEKVLKSTKYKKIAGCVAQVIGAELRKEDLSKVASQVGIEICGENTYSIVTAIREGLNPDLPKVEVDKPKRKKVDKQEAN